MDKRYQVFISSTFLDLQEERQAVSQALLRSDCFPAQMENWPAMDAEQMEAIKEIIDQSDYYLVISAGKYGSINPETGLSYTEMEYDYAMEVGKPIIRLLHRDPFNSLRGDQIETDNDTRKKLEAFRAKLNFGNVRATWTNPEELQKETILALLDIKKRKPARGWVPADEVASASLQLELARVQQELAETTLMLERQRHDSFELNEELRVLEGVKLTAKHSIYEIGGLGEKIEPSVDSVQRDHCQKKVAELLAIAALDRSLEFEIFRSVELELSRHLFPRDISRDTILEVEWAQLGCLSGLLVRLESVGVLDSIPRKGATGRNLTEWRVAQQARRQVRMLEHVLSA